MSQAECQPRVGCGGKQTEPLPCTGCNQSRLGLTVSDVLSLLGLVAPEIWPSGTWVRVFAGV